MFCDRREIVALVEIPKPPVVSRHHEPGTSGEWVLCLGHYCTNRDRVLMMEAYQVERAAAKNLFIRLLYLGHFDAWSKDRKLSNTRPTPFIVQFARDLPPTSSYMQIKRCASPSNRMIVPKKRRKRNVDLVVLRRRRPSWSRKQAIDSCCSILRPTTSFPARHFFLVSDEVSGAGTDQ